MKMKASNPTKKNGTAVATRNILVPTFRKKPLRSMVKKFLKGDGTKVTSDDSKASNGAEQDIDPFLYFSLSSNRLAQLRHGTDGEGGDTDTEAEERSTRLATESHPLNIILEAMAHGPRDGDDEMMSGSMEDMLQRFSF